MTQNNPIELTGFRHPITQQVFMLPLDDATAYLQFTDAFRAQLRPEGMLEEQIAQSIADTQWRLNHVRALENNIFATEAAIYAQSVPTNEPQSQAAIVNARRAAKGATGATTFSLYEHRLHRQFHKNLELLRELQAERRQLRTAELDQAAEILEMEKAKVTAAKPLTYSPADDGFGFSLSEVEAHARLQQRQRQAFQFNGALASARATAA